jgi:hypothetical protein
VSEPDPRSGFFRQVVIGTIAVISGVTGMATRSWFMFAVTAVGLTVIAVLALVLSRRVRDRWARQIPPGDPRAWWFRQVVLVSVVLLTLGVVGFLFAAGRARDAYLILATVTLTSIALGMPVLSRWLRTRWGPAGQ